MKKLKITIVLSVCFIAGFAACFGAVNDPYQYLEQMVRLYPDEPAIYLKYDRTVKMEIVADSVVVTSGIAYDMLHLNEKSNRFATDKIYSSHFVEILNIDAKTLTPNKRKYREIPTTHFKEKSEVADGIFYDDSKSISFTYPSVVPGAISSLNYSVKYADPRFLNSFYFGSFLPVLSSTLRIQVDKRIEIGHKLFNCDSIKINFRLEEDKKHKTYIWNTTEIDGFKYESSAPGMSYLAPHIIYHIREVNGIPGRHKKLADVADLYNMYSGFVGEINHEIDPQIQQMVDSLVADATDETEKVKRVFYWVQDNIKYIAFENGMRGFIPHDGALVCKKRYGDCKDMASVLQYLLKAAGIPSYLTWIGSRDIPYRYSEIPTPQVDNHMIATYENEGKLYFLDATSKYTPLGYPSSMIQGKEALISINADSFKIVTVPVVEKEANLVTDSIRIEISDQTLTGSGSISVAGYPKIYTTYNYVGAGKMKEKEFINALTEMGNNKYFIDEYEIRHMQSKDRPLEVNYRFKLEDYHKKIGDEIYLNLNLDKSYFNSFIDLASRKQPIENEFCKTNAWRTFFQIPENFEVDYLPANASFEDERFGFTIGYRIENNQIVQEKDIYINYLLLEKNDFKAWNMFIEKLNEAYREVLILKKI